VSANPEPIRIIKRAACHCPLSGASFCGQPDTAAAHRTERELQPLTALIGSLLKLGWPCTRELDLLVFEKDLDRKRAASPSLTGGAVARERLQGLPAHPVPHAFAQAPTLMGVRVV
jgi:hypothetical protein